MGIGELTKQLAVQAVEGIVTSEASPSSAGPSSSMVETMSSLMLGELQAMQRGMKDDQELVVTCATPGVTLRVREIYVRSPQVAVLTGVDSDNALTRVICPFESLVLVCKPSAVTAGSTALRVRVVVPKPQS